MAQAEVLQVFDGWAVENVLARAVGRRGAPILSSILHEYEVGASVTESELEERFLALCLEAGIRRPRVNEWIVLDGGAVKVDFLLLAGYRVVRCTWRQVVDQPHQVAATVSRLLES